MARVLRLKFEGAVYHLCARGNERQRVFRTEQHGAFISLELLARSATRYPWRLNYAAVAQWLRRLTFEDKQEAARLLSKCSKI